MKKMSLSPSATPGCDGVWKCSVVLTPKRILTLVPAATHLALGEQPVGRSHCLLLEHPRPDRGSNRRDGGMGARPLFQQARHIEGLTNAFDLRLTLARVHGCNNAC